MCMDCGCGINSVGMGLGMTPVTSSDVPRDGESGLTLGMVSTPEQTRQFINE